VIKKLPRFAWSIFIVSHIEKSTVKKETAKAFFWSKYIHIRDSPPERRYVIVLLEA